MIIGLTGLAGSGKSATAEILREKGFRVVSLADPLKRVAKDMFGFTDEQLWGPSANRNRPDEKLPKLEKLYIDGIEVGVSCSGHYSPREVLQLLGTEFGRAVCEDVWVNMLLKDIHRNGLACLTVIPDVRFDNEAQAIRTAGGQVWQIIRPGAGLSGSLGLHASEAGVQSDLVDVTILNNGDLTDLARKVSENVP